MIRLVVKGTMKKTCFPKAEFSTLSRLYLSGWSSQELANRYGFTKTSICRILKRIGVQARPGGPVPYACDACAFDEVSDESAYWVGFLMADGNIGYGRHGGGQQSVNLCLAKTDKSHVKKFKNFVNSKSPILTQYAYLPRTGKTYPACKISIHSNKLADSLARYGVVPDKGKTARVQLLESNPHFWRGYIDGDGSIVFPKRGTTPFISCVSGSREIMEQLAVYIARLDTNPPPTVTRGHGSWDVRVHGARAAYLATHLYKGATISLDRKQERANRLMQYTTTSVQFFKPPA